MDHKKTRSQSFATTGEEIRSLWDESSHFPLDTYEDTHLIDELKREEEEKAQQLQLFMHSTNDCLWNWDLTSNEVVRNISFEKAFGYTAEDIDTGIAWWVDRLHPDDKPRVLETFESACEQGLLETGYQYRFRRKNGTYAIIQDSVRIIRDENSKVIRSLGAMKDISERIKADEEIEFRNEIISRMHDGVHMISAQTGCFIYTNSALDQMFGYERNELLGKHVSVLNAPGEADPEETATSILAELQTHGYWKGEVENIKKDGTHFWCSASVTRYTHTDLGELWISVHQDITDQKLKDKELLQAQKMDALGKLTGGVAHDFNNQLSTILGFAELITMSEAPKQVLSYAQKIMAAAERSQKLIRKLLAFSRKQDVHLETLDIHEEIEGFIDILRFTIDKRIELKSRFRCLKTKVNGDKALIQNAFLNLAVNARDAMPQGGVLTISTENADINTESNTKLAPGSYIRINFKDTGQGIQLQNLGRIFEPFFTTKEDGKGTGMGLPSVYGSIKQLGGDVVVDSELGLGSTFAIYLPLCDIEEPVKSSEPEGTHERKLSSKTILAVDDEEAVRELYDTVLSEMGHQVILAKDGMEATNIYSDKWQDIDAVILDRMMPIMDGKSTLRALIVTNPAAKVILVSGYGPETSLEDLQAEGATKVLHKPFKLTELRRCINSVFES